MERAIIARFSEPVVCQLAAFFGEGVK
jgi:hypothetical protein